MVPARNLKVWRANGGSSAPPLDVNNGGEAATTEAPPAERPIHPEANSDQIIAGAHLKKK
jgi:hypothetical protein